MTSADVRANGAASASVALGSSLARGGAVEPASHQPRGSLDAIVNVAGGRRADATGCVRAAMAAGHQLVKSIAAEHSGFPAKATVGLLPNTLDTLPNRAAMPAANDKD
ncbi:hypothetical protein HK100_002742 [Physocladia obscura]|uniref:Uncharacterized protein n=1 Tax=Physocladia obscura TaxID=109957 RepID=A0AAD5SVY3_9FUNG|nr:hypothetical protein HK100_002742 [Physocladia obscura]